MLCIFLLFTINVDEIKKKLKVKENFVISLSSYGTRQTSTVPLDSGMCFYALHLNVLSSICFLETTAILLRSLPWLALTVLLLHQGLVHIMIHFKFFYPRFSRRHLFSSVSIKIPLKQGGESLLQCLYRSRCHLTLTFRESRKDINIAEHMASIFFL